MSPYLNKSQSNNISVVVRGTWATEGRETHRDIHLHPCTCLQTRKTAAALQSARVQENTQRHMHSPRKYKYTSWDKWKHTNTGTNTCTERKAPWSLTHSFQSGSLERTARHCLELELKTEAEKRRRKRMIVCDVDGQRSIDHGSLQPNALLSWDVRSAYPALFASAVG